ncbi:MAG: restriction endonuclease subunit S [Pseudomonadales bacterium]
MSFRTYVELKDSGVEWIGSVPTHWKVERFKNSVSTCKNGTWGDEPEGTEFDIQCVRVADFDRQRCVVGEVPTIRNVGERERLGRLLSSGNLLLEKSGGGDLQPVGFVVLYDKDQPAVCSNFVARMELVDGMNPSFWRYCHAAAYAVRLNQRSIKQTSGIQNLDQSQYLNELAPYPPEEEQKAIASFLDTETSKIDALIAEQQRLIELLKEKRQAVINHAVTKGLDPDAPMKPSGIGWIGEIPEHWAMKRLKHVSPSISVGIVVEPSKYVSEDQNDPPFIYGGDIREERIDWTSSRRITPNDSNQQFKSRLDTGDVLTVRVGAPGVTAVVPEECEGGNCASVMLIRKGRFDSYWLCYVMNSFVVRNQIEVVQYGAAQKQFNISHAVDFVVPFPSLEEHTAIVASVREATMKIDSLISEAVRGIELLQERRSVLISAAVTGKIDVRDHLLQGAV